MTDDTILPFSFPAVHAKKVTAAFDGGRLTSNGGVMLLAMAERRLGLAPAGHFKFLRVWSVKFLHPRGRTRDC
ncbi:hypothetical protein ACVIWV_007624 [Bradyrhizobium diazoefficiens]